MAGMEGRKNEMGEMKLVDNRKERRRERKERKGKEERMEGGKERRKEKTEDVLMDAIIESEQNLEKDQCQE